MKSSSILFLFIISLVWFVCSCGSDRKPSEPKTETRVDSSACSGVTDLSLEIDMPSTTKREAITMQHDVVPVQSMEFQLKSDSVADLFCASYDVHDNSYVQQKNDVLIRITFYSTKGHKLKATTYEYMNFEADYFCKVSIETQDQVLWFNWATGMPRPGAVEVSEISMKRLCADIKLQVNNTQNRNIGYMKLQGHISYDGAVK